MAVYEKFQTLSDRARDSLKTFDPVVYLFFSDVFPVVKFKWYFLCPAIWNKLFEHYKELKTTP